MTYLSRDDILKKDDLEIRDVDVPEWGGVVRVRALSGTDRDAYQASMMRMGEDGQLVPDFGNTTAKLIARVVVDDDGNPLFNELDIGLLGQKSSVALARVFEVAAELSGITDQALEVAEGNSGAAPSGGSTSSLPETSSTAP